MLTAQSGWSDRPTHVMQFDVKTTSVAEKFTDVAASPERRLRRAAVHTPSTWPSRCYLHSNNYTVFGEKVPLYFCL